MKFSYKLLKKIVPGLPPAAALAARLNSYSFEVEEVRGDVMDVKLPANIYSYASSHAGLAREAAAIFGLEFKYKAPSMPKLPAKKGRVRVAVQDKNCRRYSARYFEIPKMAATPADIKAVLKTCGANSVNLVVDIMNYVTLLTGQPLHAFDADFVAKDAKGAAEIIVRKAKQGEELETLDKKMVSLDPSVMVIADQERALAIAGVKGGLYSGVTGVTKRIIMETASFEPISVYKASRATGVATDSSLRYWHNLSPALVGTGADHATELLKKAGAKLIDSADYFPEPAGDTVIDFDPEEYEKLVGAPIPLVAAIRSFKSLGFNPKAVVKKGKKILQVSVPSWRNDVTNFEDLAEDAGRLQGYNQLAKKAPRVALSAVEEDGIFALKDRIRSLLPRLGLDEIYTSSFVSEGEVEMENPIADDRRYLRPALSPLLLKSVADNARYYDSVRIFEVGKIFSRQAGAVRETLSLGLALGVRKDPKIILELKEIVLEFLKSEGAAASEAKERTDGLEIYVNGEQCGSIKMHALERGWMAAVAEVNLDIVRDMKASGASRFKLPPKYPSIHRDVSIAISEEDRVGNVTDTIMAIGEGVEDVYSLPDDYADASLGNKRKHVLRVTFRAPDRTLTDEEVNQRMADIIKAIVERHNAEIR